MAADGTIQVVYGAQNRALISDALGIIENSPSNPADRQAAEAREEARRLLRRYPAAVVEAVRNGR